VQYKIVAAFVLYSDIVC